MANQYTQGLASLYINGIMVPQAEEFTYSFPQELRKYAESNMGPLTNVLSWNKEPGKCSTSIVHYATLDFAALIADNTYFNITANFRSGDILTITSAILAEAPSNTGIAGTTEFSFSFMNYDYEKADSQ